MTTIILTHEHVLRPVPDSDVIDGAAFLISLRAKIVDVSAITMVS